MRLRYIVGLVLAATLVLGCGKGVGDKLKSKTTDYAAKVCVNTAMKKRAVQGPCENNESGFGWVYFSGDTVIPAVGKKIPSGGDTKEPDGPLLVRIPDDQGGVTAQAVALNEKR